MAPFTPFPPPPTPYGAKMPNQSPSQTTPDNAGVGGDLKTPYIEHPKGEPTHDEQHHRNGIDSQFLPLTPVK